METNSNKTASLGAIIVTAFDQAAIYSNNPVEITRLATQAIRRLMQAQLMSPATPLSTRKAPQAKAATMKRAGLSQSANPMASSL